ncbi:hypothetical protein L7F22_028920 [Adiantum nelumboides]|nr:hypothetical protein [Adiantum nelumboides]
MMIQQLIEILDLQGETDDYAKLNAVKSRVAEKEQHVVGGVEVPVGIQDLQKDLKSGSWIAELQTEFGLHIWNVWQMENERLVAKMEELKNKSKGIEVSAWGLSRNAAHERASEGNAMGDSGLNFGYRVRHDVGSFLVVEAPDDGTYSHSTRAARQKAMKPSVGPTTLQRHGLSWVPHSMHTGMQTGIPAITTAQQQKTQRQNEPPLSSSRRTSHATPGRLKIDLPSDVGMKQGRLQQTKGLPFASIC